MPLTLSNHDMNPFFKKYLELKSILKNILKIHPNKYLHNFMKLIFLTNLKFK